MKNIFNTLMIAGAMVAIQTPAEANNPTSNEHERIVRQDKVRSDLATPADRRDTDVYFRTVTMNESDQYAVEVRDAEGNLRMTGSYSDEALQKEEGLFTFYYANGNIESKGLMVNGMKTGTWERFSADGTPKAERNYTGLTWEDMAVTLGAASKAETH